MSNLRRSLRRLRPSDEFPVAERARFTEAEAAEIDDAALHLGLPKVPRHQAVAALALTGARQVLAGPAFVRESGRRIGPPCPACDGAGLILNPHGAALRCPKCDGSGRYVNALSTSLNPENSE